jgi:hypothetical protein
MLGEAALLPLELGQLLWLWLGLTLRVLRLLAAWLRLWKLLGLPERLLLSEGAEEGEAQEALPEALLLWLALPELEREAWAEEDWEALPALLTERLSELVPLPVLQAVLLPCRPLLAELLRELLRLWL